MAHRSVPVVLLTATVLLAALAALAGCAPQQEPAPAPAQAACTKEHLATRTVGKLTIGTDEPAYPPWFIDNKPESGEGFESAVAYAVADKLGYAREDVRWIRVPFNVATAPGPKDFDFDLSQLSITDERKQSVDFSAPYYLVRQAVLALKSSRIAGKTTLADLKGAKLGAQVGTTSYQAITDVIKPGVSPRVYNNNDDAKKALRNAQLDGLVVDLATAFQMAAELDRATLIGQLPQVGLPEAFGLVLDKSSGLTGCVTGAVNALRDAGVLAELEKKWLAQVAGAVELT